MSDTNQITVRGRVGTEPEVVVMGNDKQMTKFRLASTRSYRDSTTGEWRDKETEWFTVKTWGSAGQTVVQSIHRGMPVMVQGALSSEEWAGAERVNHTNVITAHAIAVDIKYGLVTYSKITRLTPPGAATDEEPATGPDGEEMHDDDADGPSTADLALVDPWEKAPADA